MLEILLVLEQHWAANRLGCYGIALLTKTSYNACRFASSQLEWMNEHVVKVCTRSLFGMLASYRVCVCACLCRVCV